MGFFSWRTQDTERSIANAYSAEDTFRVVMTDDKGNQWVEEEYEGYGVFGGKDYYELLAEMNGLSTIEEGIDLEYGDKPHSEIKFPSLSEDGKYYDGEKPESCEFQGYFYYEDEEVDEDC